MHPEIPILIFTARATDSLIQNSNFNT